MGYCRGAGMLCIAAATLRGDDTAAQQELIQKLLARVDALEQRVRDLEGASPAKAEPPSDVREHTAAESKSRGPSMNIRGYADVDYFWEKNRNSMNTFALGQMDLFITSRLSDRISVLFETVVDHEPNNSTGIDIERFLLQYRQNEYLNIAAGRYHSSIGYYSTAYHHGNWLQTATGRPALYFFEDAGGLLPIHNVGVSVTGRLPSGPLGLRYAAETGNGRAYRNSEEAVQSVVDENNGKSLNFALSAQPEALQGWRFGTSAYRDNLTPSVGAGIHQRIFSAYAVLDRPGMEFLNEGVWMRHNQGGRVTSVPGWYSQFSYRLGVWRPYVRYEWMNRPGRDPIIQASGEPAGLLQLITGGVRYDFTDYAALKFFAGRRFQRSSGDAFVGGVQLAFTF